MEVVASPDCTALSRLFRSVMNVDWVSVPEVDAAAVAVAVEAAAAVESVDAPVSVEPVDAAEVAAVEAVEAAADVEAEAAAAAAVEPLDCEAVPLSSF